MESILARGFHKEWLKNKTNSEKNHLLRRSKKKDGSEREVGSDLAILRQLQQTSNNYDELRSEETILGDVFEAEDSDFSTRKKKSKRKSRYNNNDNNNNKYLDQENKRQQ